jgi:glycosyltransferase involved in cell wall biosynthesis
MHKPTILQVIPELDTGGAELSTLEMVEAVAAAGGRTLVVSEGGRMAGKVAENGGKLIKLPVASKSPLRMLANIRALVNISRQHEVDLIHARSRAPAWSALFAARYTGTKFVTTYHGAYGNRSAPKKYYNSVMARGDMVIANSKYTAKLVQARHKTPWERLHIVYRGVDLAEFDPASVSAERKDDLLAHWRINSDSPARNIVLQPARLTDWKGQRVLIEAAYRLQKRDELAGTIFVLAGDAQGRDAYCSELREMIEKYALADTVILPGHCSDIAAAYALADIVVIASTQPEAFGRTAVEAQAMGCPVIATNIGAPVETVCDAKTGWLVPPGDADAIAEAISRARAMTGAEKDSMRKNARERVVGKFSSTGMKADTLAIYDQLLQTNLRDTYKRSIRT